MQKMFRLFVLPILAAGLLFSAPASNPKVATPAAAHVTDAQLESAIRAKLAKSKVARGIVTWEGSTQIPQHKGAATRMARTAGAVDVVNNIQVDGGNRPGIPLKRATVQ